MRREIAQSQIYVSWFLCKCSLYCLIDGVKITVTWTESLTALGLHVTSIPVWPVTARWRVRLFLLPSNNKTGPSARHTSALCWDGVYSKHWIGCHTVDIDCPLVGNIVWKSSHALLKGLNTAVQGIFSFLL